MENGQEKGLFEAKRAMSSRTVELTSVRRSVVKVFVLSSAPNWSSPWQKRPQRSSSGSGFCINAQRKQVITNAHVVQDAAPGRQEAVLVRCRMRSWLRVKIEYQVYIWQVDYRSVICPKWVSLSDLPILTLQLFFLCVAGLR